MRYFFISDEHFAHDNIRIYCKRPFQTVQEMDEAIIANYNSVVGPDDTVIHVGDFVFGKKPAAEAYIKRLKGKHIFIRGNHDKWMENSNNYMMEFTIEGMRIVACHYAMRVWNRSHFNSCAVFGHTHGRLPPVGKQWDVGVDNNNFFPVFFEQLKAIMDKQPDNPNFIKERDRR